jgi:AcrR family transcriptional regulator
LPATKKITREKILKKAVEILRKDGASALNTRSVARACKCSTQPIYHSFSGMEELEREVAKEVLKIFYGFIEREIAEGKYPEYKAVGMGYIRFAKQESRLFKYLLMGDGMSLSGMQNDSFEKSIRMIVKNYGLYESDASKLHLQMWVFVHGIASMFATEYIDWDWETVSRLVSDAYSGFSKNIKGE